VVNGRRRPVLNLLIFLSPLFFEKIKKFQYNKTGAAMSNQNLLTKEIPFGSSVGFNKKLGR
jgi:hypothetical protein